MAQHVHAESWMVVVVVFVAVVRNIRSKITLRLARTLWAATNADPLNTCLCIGKAGFHTIDFLIELHVVNTSFLLPVLTGPLDLSFEAPHQPSLKHSMKSSIIHVKIALELGTKADYALNDLIALSQQLELQQVHILHLPSRKLFHHALLN